MGERTKKRMAILLSVILCLGILGGCGNGSSNGETKSADTTADTKNQDATDEQSKEGSEKETEAGSAQGDEPIEITCWIRASSSENNQTITFDAFNASQDKIHVNYECYGDNYPEVLKLAFNSGEAPDIFEVSGGIDVKSYVDAELVTPLDDYITDEFRDLFNPSAFAAQNYGGKVYAIPEMSRFIRMYYNKELFEAAGLDPEKAPETLEEMYTMAKQITDAGAGDYYGFGLPIQSGSTWERNIDIISILSGLTGPYAFDYTTGRFDFAKEKEIIEYFSKMYAEGILMPGSESIDIEMIRAYFVEGKIGMYFDGNWMVNGYNNEIEGGDTFEWETALIPIFEGNERAKDYLMLDSGRCISQSSENKEAAFEVIQYAIRNIYSAPTEKNPEVILPSFSLIEEDNQLINNSEAVQSLKGMKGASQQDMLALFPVTPHLSLTLEGDSRDSVYPLLVIQGSQMDIDSELQKLTDTYNTALDKAIEEGILDEADLKPAGFDYFTR